MTLKKHPSVMRGAYFDLRSLNMFIFSSSQSGCTLCLITISARLLPAAAKDGKHSACDLCQQYRFHPEYGLLIDPYIRGFVSPPATANILTMGIL